MALQFTQSGDSLSNAVTAGVNFQNAASASTITCWINAPWSGATHSYVGLYDEKQRASLGTSTAIQLGSRTVNTFDVWTWGGGILVTSSIPTTPGAWVFLAYTFDGTTHRCYVNGVLGGSSTAAQLTGNFDSVYLNGYSGSGSSETATFQLDTYNYYNRALSAAELLTMYTSKGNRHGIVFGSLTRYEFDGGAMGSSVTTVPNLTNFSSANSNLAPIVPAGSTRVSYIAGFAGGNLRPGA